MLVLSSAFFPSSEAWYQRYPCEKCGDFGFRFLLEQLCPKGRRSNSVGCAAAGTMTTQQHQQERRSSSVPPWNSTITTLCTSGTCFVPTRNNHFHSSLRSLQKAYA